MLLLEHSSNHTMPLFLKVARKSVYAVAPACRYHTRERHQFSDWLSKLGEAHEHLDAFFLINSISLCVFFE